MVVKVLLRLKSQNAQFTTIQAQIRHWRVFVF